MGRTGALPCKLYMEEGGEQAGDGGKGRGRGGERRMNKRRREEMEGTKKK